MEVSEYPLALLSNFEKLVSNEKFCDIEIVVDNQLYSGHKIILAAASSQLHKLIEETKNENGKAKILLSGISSVGFAVLFKFMYSGVLNINETNIQDVTMAAMVLGVNSALMACTEFQRQKLSACNLSTRSSVSDQQDQGTPTSGGEIPAIQNEPKQEVFVVSEESNSPPPQWSPQSVDTPSFSGPKTTQGYNFVDITETMDQVFKNNSTDESINSGGTSAREKISYTEEKDDDGDTVWRCKHCSKIFRTLSYLKNNHIPLHTGSRYWCKHCKKSYSTKTSLLNHVKLHLAKQGFQPYTCSICQKTFSSQKACTQHRNTHSFKYFCEHCSKGFANNDECSLHVKNHHSNILYN
uniref:ZF(C2H2)-4 zinc finger protein n=1 Tax=Phallusia mammillata TaxID=59560 RepID=A0A6F9DXG5_9ASCI|nr:ZF(C2H2)-4 zinc finger protein [Phallusia mammillata]